jgi:dTDP-4-dehydrorhamnose 3,5-epimerase-like enzyme
MQFVELSLPGVYLIKPEPIHDNRGFNARLWCEEEFLEHGIDFRIVQVNAISNGSAGTLRGFQKRSCSRSGEEPSSTSSSICAGTPRPVCAGRAWS